MNRKQQFASSGCSKVAHGWDERLPQNMPSSTCLGSPTRALKGGREPTAFMLRNLTKSQKVKPVRDQKLNTIKHASEEVHRLESKYLKPTKLQRWSFQTNQNHSQHCISRALPSSCRSLYIAYRQLHLPQWRCV